MVYIKGMEKIRKGGKQSEKKFDISRLRCIFSCFTLSSNPTHASNEVKVVEVTPEDVAKIGNVVKLINEIDKSGLNMDDLSKNSPEDIEKLSDEAQEFYYLYKNELLALKDKNQTASKEEAAQFIHKASNQMGTEATTSSIGSIKKYYLTNQDVNDIVKASNWNGGFWAVITGIAQKYGKKPTWATAVIIGISILGAATLDICNRKGKGVVIQDVRIGATHQWSCYSR